MPRRELSTEELAGIEREIAAKMPPGLSDDDFDRLFGPAYEQAVGIAENSPAPLHGSAMSRAMSGIWQNLNPASIAKGLYDTVRHPLDTGKAILYDQPKAMLEKAANADTLSERIGYGAAAVLPVIGPMSAQAGETAASGDVAGGIGQGVGLIAPIAATAAVRASRASQARSGVPTVLRREAVQQVADKVLAPGNVRFRGRAQATAQGILDRGLSGSRDALREAADVGMQDAGDRIDAAIQSNGGPKSAVDVNPIVAQLRQKMDDLSVNGQPIAGNERKVAELQRRIDQIETSAQTQPPRTVQPPNAPMRLQSFEELQKYRDQMYAQADEARAYERNGNPRLKDKGFASAETGSAIRSEFARLAPDLASANADYTFFRTLGDVLDPAQGRPKQTGPTSGVTGGSRTVGAVMGSMIGPKAGFALSVVKPWIEEIRARPEWQLASAQDKLRLAKAIETGNIGRAKSLMAKISAVPRQQTTSPNESQTRTIAPAW